MAWFIFSEVMFFGAFFGALFYARSLSVPWLGGEGTKMATNLFLWNGFEAGWPSNGPANIGGAFQTIPAFSKPLVNRSEKHTSELPSLMRISYAVLCLQNKTQYNTPHLIL